MMVDNNQVELVNQKSFVNQKFNLTSIESNEIFLIPAFTLITTPVIGAENINCYELFFVIKGVYWKYFPKWINKFGQISDVIFQYDLNYSKEPHARGQLLLFKNLAFQTSIFGNIAEKVFDSSDLSDWNKVPYEKNLIFETRILLPVKAVKKNQINTFHYSFNASRQTNFPYSLNNQVNKDWHINNQNNSGILNFYINDNPKYRLQTIPKILDKKINILTINNPLIFQTFIPKIDIFTFNLDDSKGIGFIKGQSLFDETFKFIFNNFNSLNVFPLKVQHYISSNSYNSGLIDLKIWEFVNKNWNLHHGDFNLQQNLSLNIIDTNNNIGIKKVAANLVANEDTKDNKAHINFQEYLLQLNNEIYSPLTDKIVNEFPFPYDKKLNFSINMPLKFETFFNYDIDFNFIEHTAVPIIGDENSLINSSVTDKKFSDINWQIEDKIILSFEQIRQYYGANNFTFNDYEELISGGNNNGF